MCRPGGFTDTCNLLLLSPGPLGYRCEVAQSGVVVSTDLTNFVNKNITKHNRYQIYKS